MGTHSWSVPPLGLLALFSAATQVSPHSARNAFYRISIFSEFSGVSPHSARSAFSRPVILRVSWSIPPIRPHSVFRFFPGVSPHSAPPSFFLFPAVFPHPARRQFPSCLEYPPTPHRDFPSFLESPLRRHSTFPKFSGVPHLTIPQAPYTRSVARTSNSVKRSTRSGALRSHTS